MFAWCVFRVRFLFLCQSVTNVNCEKTLVWICSIDVRQNVYQNWRIFKKMIPRKQSWLTTTHKMDVLWTFYRLLRFRVTQNRKIPLPKNFGSKNCFKFRKWFQLQWWPHRPLGYIKFNFMGFIGLLPIFRIWVKI